jgi:alkylhydroperoxidase family enzyme
LTAYTATTPETIEAMKKTFDDEEFLELTFVVATANMFNRLAEGLAVELEPEFVRKPKED